MQHPHKSPGSCSTGSAPSSQTSPFPNGNWLTNDIYYNSQKDEYKVINPNAIIDRDTISKNSEIASKKLEISNDIILYDLIKNESKKERLDRVEGEANE